ncbi:hypothetical protein [Streptomyces sp. bgisy159]|uniref:hypothetical protein n=1 Tax=Streptomyces sp. bgisy159 TaxID=3413795 RepID=UPI003F49FE38
MYVVVKSKSPKRTRDLAQYADSLRGAAGGGLTVVGILLPVSVLAVQLSAGSGAFALPDNAIADFFMAAFWLFLSLFSGVYVLFAAAIRGPKEDVARRKDVGILYGAQLFFLLVAGYRLLWGVSAVTTSMLV